jgi:hypothetical protein
MMSDGAEQVEIVKRPRVFRRRVNFRFQSFFKFNERFGLRSLKMEVLSNAIGDRLQHETQRNYALSIGTASNSNSSATHQLFSLLSKLAAVVQISCQAFCLDCLVTWTVKALNKICFFLLISCRKVTLTE